MGEPIRSAAADLLLVGGVIHRDFSSGTGPAQAMAISGDRVLATGSTEDMCSAATPGARIIDLDGRTVVPGFIDAHAHPVHAGVGLESCSLSQASDLSEALTVVARYAAEHTGQDWISGSGWAMEWFTSGTSARTLLDDVVADRPILLMGSDGHSAWVNTATLTLAGIDALTPDPSDGRFDRESDGTPSGILYEGAIDLVSRHQPEPDPALLRTGLLRAQEHLHSLGVTGWQDAIVGRYAALPDVLQTYCDAAATGELTARVVGALWWDRTRGLEQVPDLIARRQHAGGAAGIGRFRATTVKIMQDGVVESCTAALLSPYRDVHGRATLNSGLSHVEPRALNAAVERLDAEGFQVHLHTLGDRAVREALDALQSARAANGAHDLRHHLAHLQVVDAADIPRFAELDATANIQALWAAHSSIMDELSIPLLPASKASRQFPFADLVRAGATLCAGSDWPVSSANPLEAVHVAVNRAYHGIPSHPFLPEQAIGVESMLDAYTRGSARVNGDDRAGVLAPGSWADFAVLDADPVTADPSDLGGIGVTSTHVGGQMVFSV